MAGADVERRVAMLRDMMLIRRFERRLLELPEPGFQLLSSGEEGVAVGICAALGGEDQLLCSGRSIGPALARGISAPLLMAEVLGRREGVCRGQAGRGHVSQPDAGLFGAHAVVAGNLSVAAGVALAMQLQRRNGIVACMFGDGACGAGALHEVLNIAALQRLPLLFVCSNNGYAVSTPVSAAIAVSPLADLARPFAIEARTVDGMDVEVVASTAQELVSRVRCGGGPAFLECISYRFSHHSTASRERRSAGEVQSWQARCPIGVLRERLLAGGAVTVADLFRLEQAVEVDVEAAARFAVNSSDPDPDEAMADVG